MWLSSKDFVSSEVISHKVFIEEDCNDVLNRPVNLKKFPTEPKVPRAEEIFTCPEWKGYEGEVHISDPDFNKPPDDSYTCPTINTERKFKSTDDANNDQDNWKTAEQDRKTRRLNRGR